MNNQFFERPILNSPYGYPIRHWELDQAGQPTQQIIETRRRAEFITPIPKPKKRKGAPQQDSLLFDEGAGLTTSKHRYDHTAIINSVRQQVDQWRKLPNTNDWRVTPETARLLQHWRQHKFGDNLGFEVPYRYGSETRKYLPDFIVRVDDGHGEEDLLNLIVEIKSYRREDAKEKKSTMDTYWVPGVNNLGTHGRWAFAEFTEVYQIESDFEAKIKSEFDKMIERVGLRAGSVPS